MFRTVFHRLAVALATFLALTQMALSQCAGNDLIAALPEHERNALKQRAAETPHGEGLLWHAVRGDTRITFFGTYHFRHAQTDAHLEALKPFVAAADRVYLEVSNADTRDLQRRMADDPSIMFVMEGPTLPDLLGDADWARLADEFRARQIPAFFGAKFKPIWAAMMLGIGPCEAQAGVMDADGIDTLIGSHAEATGRPALSLEDAVTTLQLLDGFPQDEQLDMLRLFFDLDLDADDLSHTLKTHYLDQKTALLWEYSRKVSLENGGPTAAEDFARFESVLLEQRNRAWVAQMLDPGFTGDVLVAVGAAHLPGDMGVLNLLEVQGFSITRLPFAP